jgi:glycosyltransferase involved in cell wall biosynthesis
MHILVIPSWYPEYEGDVNGSFFREQALALYKHGCKVGVIYPQLRSLRKWKSIIPSPSKIIMEEDNGIKTYRSHGVNWFPRTVNAANELYVWHGMCLYNKYIAENGEPDLIHVQSMLNAGVLALRLDRKKNIPFVVTEHGSNYARKKISQKQIEISKKISASAKRKFAVSNQFANLLNDTLGIEWGKWDVMPNIVSDAFIEYPLIEGVEGHFKFINVALMDDNKDQKNIIYAFKELKKKHNNITLEMVGDGPERGNLQMLVMDLGIENNVNFTGLLSRNDVVEKISKANALILSSKYETFGVVIIEALALGKPVIATRCGGPESIVREKDGILIPIENRAELCSAMDQMISGKNNYNAVEIRKSCIDRYSESSVAKRLMDIYLEILKQK